MPSRRFAACSYQRLLHTVSPLVLVSTMGVPASPSAAESSLATSAQVRLTSDYLYRGYSKSDDRASVQLHAGASAANGFYAGAWLNRVQFGDARWEGTPYAGWRTRVGDDWRLEATLAGYLYDDELDGDAGHYAETYVSAHYQDWLSLRASLAVDAYGFGADTPDVEAKIRYPLSDALQLTASLGHAWLDDFAGYDVTHYSLGVGRILSPRVRADLGWYGAVVGSERVGAPAHDFFERLLIDDRIAASISFSF